MMDVILRLFCMLGCSLQPFQKLLGDKQPSVYQLKLTLLLITEKIKEYKENVYYYERCMAKKTKKSNELINRKSRLKKYTVYGEKPVPFEPIMMLSVDPCPACVETRWFSRISDGVQPPLNKEQALQALAEMSSDPAYLRSDRIHTLAECKVPRSRALLAGRYVKY